MNSAIGFNHWIDAENSLWKKFCPCLKPDINKIVTKQFFENVAEASLKQPEMLQKCLKKLKLDRLISILNQHSLLRTDLDTTIASLHEAYQELYHQSIPPSQPSDYFRNLRKVIDTLLSAFSVFSLVEGSATTYEASQVISVYSRMLAVPFAMITALNILMGNSVAAVLATALAISVLAIGIIVYVKFVRPFPRTVEGFKDCTALAREGAIKPIIGQEEYQTRIQTHVQADERVLLVGEPGSGKNSIGIQELARRIVAGETIANFRFTHLLGGSVHNLIPNFGDDANKFVHLLFAIERHAHKTIVVLNEIHEAIRFPKLLGKIMDDTEDKNSVFAAKCGFIALTTPEGYAQLNQMGVLRRWRVVFLEQLDDKKTVQVLKQFARQEAPEINISDTVLNSIYTQSKQHLKKNAQPDISLKILAKCFAEMQKIALSSTQKEYQAAKLEYREACSSYLDALGTENEASQNKQRNQKKGELPGIKQKVLTEKNTTQQLVMLKKQLHTQTVKVVTLADQVFLKKIPAKMANNAKKEIAFFVGILKPLLKRMIEKLEKEIEASMEPKPKFVLDEALVEKLVKEEAALQQQLATKANA